MGTTSAFKSILVLATVLTALPAAAKKRGKDYELTPGRPVMESVADLGVSPTPKKKWQFAISPVLGASLSDAAGSGSDNTRMRPGFIGGGLVDIGKGHWYLNSGLLYRQAGFVEETQTLYRTVQLDYLSIPIMGKWSLVESLSRSTFYVKAGAMISLLLSQSMYSEVGPYSFENDNANANDFDFGAIAGVGGSYKVADGVLITLEATYYRSIGTSVRDVRGNWSNSTFQLLGGMTFPL